MNNLLQVEEDSSSGTESMSSSKESNSNSDDKTHKKEKKRKTKLTWKRKVLQMALIVINELKERVQQMSNGIQEMEILVAERSNQ
jgi:hypothetical protein